MAELDSVLADVDHGVGPDGGPDVAGAGLEHGARYDTRNRRPGRASVVAGPDAGPSHHC